MGAMRMAFRFRKRIKVAPGLTLNLGKKGVSTTLGVPGASVNVGPQGVHGNAGLAGTGLSVRQKLSAPKAPAQTSKAQRAAEPAGKPSKAWLWILVGVVLGVALASLV